MPNALVLTNKKFGRLTALYANGHRKNHITWMCMCDCGKSYITTGRSLNNGTVHSCGCWKKEQSYHLKLTRKKFGRLTVLRRSGNIREYVAWDCQCDCGKYYRTTGRSLVAGTAQSCGCLKRDNSPAGAHLINRKFGKLIVIKRFPTTKPGKRFWVCRCECGNEIIVSSTSLLQGKNKTCKSTECRFGPTDMRRDARRKYHYNYQRMFRSVTGQANLVLRRIEQSESIIDTILDKEGAKMAKQKTGALRQRIWDALDDLKAKKISVAEANAIIYGVKEYGKILNLELRAKQMGGLFPEIPLNEDDRFEEAQPKH